MSMPESRGARVYRETIEKLSRPPASETPGPGEGDLRGEVDEPAGIDGTVDPSMLRRSARVWQSDIDRIVAERDAAVEQRTLAEQKVARVEALCDNWMNMRGSIRQFCADDILAALADPEADR